MLVDTVVLFFHSFTGVNTPLAHVVVITCSKKLGGVFPSSHWHKYSTCTVWWWLHVVVVVVVYYTCGGDDGCNYLVELLSVHSSQYCWS